MLLIGSRAAKYHFSDFRQPKDWDFITTAKELASWVREHRDNIAKQKLRDDEKKVFVHLKTGERIEFEIARPETSSEDLLDMDCQWNGRNRNIGSYDIADPVTLFYIKASHVKHPIRWEKTIADYHFLLEKCRQRHPRFDTVISVGHMQTYKLREQEVDSRFKAKPKVNLNMKNEEFFAKSESKLGRAYVHDDLHRVTAYGDVPMYQKLKHDLSKAKLDKDLWDGLSFEDKVKTVREESYAIALERVLIPAMEENKELDEKSAFDYALMRICTTLTKGWFQEFAIGNWPVIKDYDRSFLKLFQDAVTDGKIRRIDRG